MLHKARSLQARTTPNATTHDEVEFALFEAEWRASLQRSSLFHDLKACAGSDDASATHRVACGLLGLKIAFEENRIDAMEELYLTMVPLLKNSRIAPAIRLEAEMIYHSTCGDMRRAEEATDQLLRAVRDEPDPRTRARALLNVGLAYRRAGRGQDAEAVLLELLDYSVAHGLVSRTSFGLLMLARVYLSAGDLPRTREVMQRLEALASDDQDHHLAGDRLYMFARLALDEGNIAEATERYAELAARTSPSESAIRQIALLALGIRIGVQQRASIETLWRTVAQLEAAHLQNRSWGAQDFEAHALALGLCYCGEPEKGLLLLAEYVTIYRRDREPLPQELSDLLQELRGNFQMPPTCRTNSCSGDVETHSEGRQ